MKNIKSALLITIISFCLTPIIALSTDDTSSSISQSTGQFVDDTSITTKVKSNLLMDKDVKSLSISVTTTNGVVTLSGNVDDSMQKMKALKIAEAVSGVKSVKDELIVTAKTN